MIKNWKKSLIPESSSLSMAIKAISSNQSKVAVIINRNKNVLGLLTDGDIRRAILNEKNLKTKALSVATKNPLVIPNKINLEKIKQILDTNDLFQLPVVDEKNRIVNIVTSTTLSLKKKINKSPFLIMCGGFGKRLLPLTKTLPKPLIKIGNERILDKILFNIKKYNFNQTYISVHYLSNKIIDYVKNGKKWNLKVSYINEKKPLGTAGCLYYLKDKIKLPLIITNGDIITSLNFEEMLIAHNKNKSDITVALQSYKINIPFAVVETEELLIKGIIEKPTMTKKINAGIYIINPKIINKLIKKPVYLDMPDLIKLAIKNKKKVTAFPIHEDWEDIGSKKL